MVIVDAVVAINEGHKDDHNDNNNDDDDDYTNNNISVFAIVSDNYSKHHIMFYFTKLEKYI